ncbi:UNVERIFIED_ORG: hypothetical protein E4P37_10005 [Bacillus sp. AZ43]
MGVTPEQVAAWLAASCAEQGLSVQVTDPHVLADVVALLSAQGGSGPARSAGRGRPAEASDPPDGSDSGRVQGATAALSGVDDAVVEDR